MYLISPLAYPIALMLDKLMGRHHGIVFEKAGLKHMISLHHQVLGPDEMRFVTEALDFKDKPISAVMTPLPKVYSLTADAILDDSLKQEILDCGYSRVPIRAPNDTTRFEGFLTSSHVVICDYQSGTRLRQLPLSPIRVLEDNISCMDVMQTLHQQGSQMAVLVGAGGAMTGIVTMADLVHELIGKRILGEYNALSRSTAASNVTQSDSFMY